LGKIKKFSTGGELIGGKPTNLLIRGNHLFFNYQFFLGNGKPHLILLFNIIERKLGQISDNMVK
jgi:hypothetical protein